MGSKSGRRIRIGPGGTGSDRSDASKWKEAKAEEVDPYWQAQHKQFEDGEGSNPPEPIEVTIHLQGSTQVETKGNSIFIASSIGYKVRFIVHDDPYLLRKLFNAALSTAAGKEAMRKVVAIEEKAKGRARAEAHGNGARKPQKGATAKIASHGAPTVDQAKRAMKYRR